MNGCPMVLLAGKGNKELLFLTKLVQRRLFFSVAVIFVPEKDAAMNNKIYII